MRYSHSRPPHHHPWTGAYTVPLCRLHFLSCSFLISRIAACMIRTGTRRSRQKPVGQKLLQKLFERHIRYGFRYNGIDIQRCQLYHPLKEFLRAETEILPVRARVRQCAVRFLWGRRNGPPTRAKLLGSGEKPAMALRLGTGVSLFTLNSQLYSPSYDKMHG